MKMREHREWQVSKTGWLATLSGRSMAAPVLHKPHGLSKKPHRASQPTLALVLLHRPPTPAALLPLTAAAHSRACVTPLVCRRT